MKIRKRIHLLLILTLLVSATTTFAQEEAQGRAEGGGEAVVRAVLFYSPTCPHCHVVMDNVLPPLADQYGEQLAILLIDVSQERGSAIYEAMVAAYELPRERLGVPALVVDEVVMVGSVEIPQRFPGLVESGLAAGGIAWPAFPGFDAAAAEAVFTDVTPETVTAPVEESTGGTEQVAVDESATGAVAGGVAELDTEILAGADMSADPVGFVLAALVTLVMVGALGYVVTNLSGLHERLQRVRRGPATSGLIPALVAVGLVVALYLSYVEITQVEAVCGPVGHCNVVQSSPYARIFGVPIAVLGVANYLVIGALWWGQRRWQGARLRMGTAGLLMATVAGTLFSIYLTLLELFVIEAVCAWCLSSAVVITALMVVVTMLIMERVAVPRQRIAYPRTG